MPQKTRKQKEAAARRHSSAPVPITVEVTQQASGQFSLPQTQVVSQPVKTTPQTPVSTTFAADSLAVRHELKRIGVYTLLFLALEMAFYWLLVVQQAFGLFR